MKQTEKNRINVKKLTQTITESCVGYYPPEALAALMTVYYRVCDSCKLSENEIEVFLKGCFRAYQRNKGDQ